MQGYGAFLIGPRLCYTHLGKPAADAFSTVPGIYSNKADIAPLGFVDVCRVSAGYQICHTDDGALRCGAYPTMGVAEQVGIGGIGC